MIFILWKHNNLKTFQFADICGEWLGLNFELIVTSLSFLILTKSLLIFSLEAVYFFK